MNLYVKKRYGHVHMSPSDFLIMTFIFTKFRQIYFPFALKILYTETEIKINSKTFNIPHKNPVKSYHARYLFGDHLYGDFNISDYFQH